MKDGTGDAWVSDKVGPWGLVKSQDKDSTMVLAKVITDAKDHITGTPKKFDPMQMMRGMGQQGQQPRKAVGLHDSVSRERSGRLVPDRKFGEAPGFIRGSRRRCPVPLPMQKITKEIRCPFSAASSIPPEYSNGATFPTIFGRFVSIRAGNSRIAPGQYATLGVVTPEKHHERPYSIVSAPHEKFLEFFFELVPHGQVTPRLHQLQVGDEITLAENRQREFHARPLR